MPLRGSSGESRELTHEPPEGWDTALIYIAAGVVYVGIGVFVPELLFSWFEGVPFLLAFVWLAGRLTRRTGQAR